MSLGGRRGVVLNEIVGGELTRRDAAELAELPAEVRLVGVTAGGCHLCDPRCSRAQRRDRAIKADHTRGGLRRKAHVVAEALDQAPWAPPEVRRKRAYADSPAAADEFPPRPVELAWTGRRLGQPFGEEGLEEIEALTPVRRCAHAWREPSCAGQQIFEGVCAVGELVRDSARPGVQPGEEAVEPRAFDDPGRAEVQDQRDSRKRQLVKAHVVPSLERPPFERLTEQRSQRWRR